MERQFLAEKFMKKSYYFSEQEFNKCTPFCCIEDMEQDFLYLMDDIRRKAGIPLICLLLKVNQYALYQSSRSQATSMRSSVSSS